MNVIPGTIHKQNEAVMRLYDLPKEKATAERVIEIMWMSWLSVEEKEAEVRKLEF